MPLLFLNRNPTVILHDLNTNIYLKEFCLHTNIYNGRFGQITEGFKNAYKVRSELIDVKTFIPERGVKTDVIPTVSRLLLNVLTHSKIRCKSWRKK